MTEGTRARSPHGEAANIPLWLQGADIAPGTQRPLLSLMLGPFLAAEHTSVSVMPPAMALTTRQA